MKEYKVTITETLKKDVYVEAENRREAEQKVHDAWRNSEYIVDDFVDVDIDAEDLTPKVELSYAELSALFRSVNDKELPSITGYVVFTSDSFDKPYSEESRTYRISNNNKAYQAGMGGYSIYASCLDGSEPCLRLDGHMFGINAWKIEKCYMIKDDYDKLMLALTPNVKSSQDRDAR